MGKTPYKESKVDFYIGLVGTIVMVGAIICMIALFVSAP